MKKFLSKLKSQATKFVTSIKSTVTTIKERIKAKATVLATRATLAVANVRADGYVDSGVKILIAVVIGALLLAGLYTLFNGTIMPTVTNKVKELFNFKG